MKFADKRDLRKLNWVCQSVTPTMTKKEATSTTLTSLEARLHSEMWAKFIQGLAAILLAKIKSKPTKKKNNSN